MEDFQKRVIEEKSDLDKKVESLRIFITGPVFPTLPKDECERLYEQHRYMVKYSDVLGRRIIAFKT